MFTLDQIKAAHSKVKSGVDFPIYIQDMIQLGVDRYSTFVCDGHTEFQGKENKLLSSDAKYPSKEIAEKGDNEGFVHA